MVKKKQNEEREYYLADVIETETGTTRVYRPVFKTQEEADAAREKVWRGLMDIFSRYCISKGKDPLEMFETLPRPISAATIYKFIGTL